MKRSMYFTLMALSLAALVCAYAMAQELPVGDPVQPPPSSIWTDASFNSSLSIIIGFGIAAITSFLKRFSFVNQQPKVVAAGISILASLATVGLGWRAGTAYGILIVSTITQLASAVLAFEVAGKALTSEPAKAARKTRKAKATRTPDPDEERTTDPL